MTFEAPWMLLGLAALAVPIWLHLRQRRAQRVPFPAVALLAQVAAIRSPRLKLRSLLILLARLIALAALVAAMARPGLSVLRPGGIRSGTALALVIVLDDSLSMRQQRGEEGTAFEAARRRALAELARLRPGDAAALVLSGRPARAVGAEVEFDLDRVRARVERARPSFRGGDIGGALVVADRLIEDAPLPQREVLLITDLAEAEWEARGLPWSDEAGVGFRVVAAVPGAAPPNAAVVRVATRPAGEGAARELLLEAVVANHGDQAIEALPVVLELDGQEAARGTVDVPAGGTAIKRFHHRFAEEGAHRGQIRIRPDALPEDDARHFSVVVRRALAALVVDGDYRPGSYLDEAFYLQRALETPLPGEVPIRSVVADVATAATGPLGGYDVVFLAGVADAPPTLSARIVDFVREGHGLFVAPGAQGLELPELAPILPGELRSIRRARRSARPFRVAAVNRVHPLFKPFGEGPTGLEQTRVLANLLFEPDPTAERAVVAELEDGIPLLLERRVGAGTVMLIATTIDREWTDLPIRPGFLPLVQRAARYLAGRLGEREPRRVQVAEPVALEVSEGMQRLVVLGPDDQEHAFPAKELAGKPAIEFAKTGVPGSYRVWAEVPGLGGLRELPAEEFVVETDPAEADLAPRAAAVGSSRREQGTAVEGRLPIWPYLLLAAMLALLLETLISGVGLRRSHARSRSAADAN